MASHIAKALLDINAVELRPHDYFTWTSGLKSPIYCDNRITMSYPEVRKQIAAGLAQLVQEHFPECQVLAGVATAGIPHAAFLADHTNLPMVYVRDAKKKHGKTNQIEGRVAPGAKVVVVEDLISTGISSIGAVEALREAGVEVLGVVAIYSYLLNKSKEAFAAANCKLVTLTNYDELVQVASETGYIQPSDLAELIAWRDALNNN